MSKKIKLLCTVFLLSTTVGIIAMKQDTHPKASLKKLVVKDTLKLQECLAPPKSLTKEINEFNKNIAKFDKIKNEILTEQSWAVVDSSARYK